MTAGLRFESAAGTKATELDKVKIITLTDGPGNKYTLDSTGSSLKLKYTPQGKAEVEYTVDGLAKALGDILGARDGQKSILVEKLGGFLASTDEVKYDSAENAANQTAKDFLAEKFPLVKTDGSNIASLTDKGKALASAILGVEYTDSDSKKRSVLVEKLGKSLGDNTDVYQAKYDGSNEQTAKDFLRSKGLGSPSAEDLVTAAIGRNPNFIQNVASMAVADNSAFQGAVREVMSKPVFEIPADDNAPLSWDW